MEKYIIKEKEMKLKHFQKHIKKCGFQLDRVCGGHLIYKMHTTTFVVPSHRIVATGIIWQFNKLIKDTVATI